MTLFGRFFIDYYTSPNELWWTDLKDGTRQWHLFDISIVEQSSEEGCRKGIQLIVLNLSICIADTKLFRKQ
ncbi:MAG TPA: hypothetical protein V6C65_00865 [Allocoleopsis sp.]